MTGLLLFGAEGRMGREVAALAAQYGFTLGEKAEAAIDFSHPDALDAVLDAVLARGIPLVSGTTGYSLAQQQQIHAAAQRVPILRSANFSLGAAVMARLLAQAASSLPGWDGALIERHHAGKVDAPSGTALALADSINESMGNAYSYVYDRSQVRKKRDSKEIGISAVRGGTIVGDHEVIYAGADEVIEFKHTAYSKTVFGKGAVEAAKFLAGKPAGRYDMSDVIQF